MTDIDGPRHGRRRRHRAESVVDGTQQYQMKGNHMRGRPKNIPLDKIIIDGGTQVRVRIDEAVVAEYAEAIERRESLPAIVVFGDGSDYWLADGFHRVMASRKAGKTQIAAQVMQGTRADAAWYACGANKTHGLRLGADDRRRAIEIAITIRPKASNKMIAEQIGCGVHLVGEVRNAVQPRAQERSWTETEGADGKARPATANAAFNQREEIKELLEAKPAASDREIAKQVGCSPSTVGAVRQTIEDEPPPTEAAPATDAGEARGTDAPGVTDRLGKPITDAKHAELFRRDDELVKLCTLLSDIKSQIGKACEAHDPLYADINPQQIAADLSNAYRQISAIRPYTTCPYCGGDGCQACRGRGVVCKLAYEAVEGKR